MTSDAWNEASPCLITGATGQIGSECVRRLNRGGVTPLVLMRRPLPSWAWNGARVEEVSGDLEDVVAGNAPAALRQALRRVRVVYHLAARVTLSGRGAAQMAWLNARVPARLLALCREAGVRRFVHVSTVGAVGTSDRPQALDEETAYNLGSFHHPYFDSKRAAEEEVLAAWREHPEATELIVVNPSINLGPPEGFRSLARRRSRRPPPAPGGWPYKLICFWFDGGLNLVDVRDCARGILLAGIHGTPGRRYILGGDNLTVRELMIHLEQTFGAGGPRIHLPRALLTGTAAATEAAARLLGRRARWNRTLASLAGYYWYVSSERAERELGYRHRPLDQTLETLLAWVRRRREEAERTA